MAKLGINTGTNADDGTGDSLKVGAGKINSNFNEVYSLLTGAGNNGTTLLSGIVTSVTAGSNITLSGGPTGAIQITAAALTGTGFFTNNSTGIHTLGSVGIGTTTAENNGLSVLGNVKVGKGVTTLNLNVSGVTTFSGGDINIKGDGTVDTTGVFWDASVATLEFDDLARISFGEGSDLTLYHDENNSWIKDQATGNLLIDSNGSAVKITKAGAAETMAEFNTDGPVKLFHNNVRVLETVSTGATVVGDLYVGGDLFVLDDVTYNEMNSVNLNVSGVSTFGGTSNLNGDLRVGVSTLFVDVSRGQIGLGTDVLTGSHLLDVDGSAVFAGLSTFSGGLVSDGDATFKGAAYNMTWDKSGNELNFPVTSSNSGRLIFGSTSYEALELKIISSIPTIQSHNQGITVQTDAGYDITLNSADDIILKNSAQVSQNWYIKCTESGASGISSVALYGGTNGAVAEKLRTDLHGVIITGVATAAQFNDSKGALRDIPLRSVTGSAATLVAADAGKVVATNTTGWTVPASTFSEGDTVSLLNNSAGNLTITCSAVTTYLTSNGTTVTSKTLGARGFATLYFVSASVAYLQGTAFS